MSQAAVEGLWSTTIQQHSERTVPDRAREFLAQGHVAHVGFQQDGLPYVIPMLYQYSVDRPDRLYLHGGLTQSLDPASRVGRAGVCHGDGSRWPGLFARRAISLGKLSLRDVLWPCTAGGR